MVAHLGGVETARLDAGQEEGILPGGERGKDHYQGKGSSHASASSRIRDQK